VDEAAVLVNAVLLGAYRFAAAKTRSQRAAQLTVAKDGELILHAPEQRTG
jgi:hypothetical protein